jgi:Xaa-Pro aminopeptidase
MELLGPGVHMRDLTFNSHKLDKNFQKGKYGCLMHGVGLCDEWPLIAYPDQFVEGAYDYFLEPGMVLCVEALISPDNGDFSIKLEDQVLITESGYENITKYPFDPVLMGNF